MKFPLAPFALLLTLTVSAKPPFDPGPSIPGAHGTELRVFAKEPFLKNTVAVCVDEQGRVYATSVVRRKAADLDIRQFRQWIETDLSLTTVEEKRAFLHRELTPVNSQRYKQIGDQNKDGHIDWQDLTVLTDRIILLEDTDHDGFADRAKTFAEGFNTEVTGIAAGITAWDETLYATVEPDILKLRDTNGDGQADAREVLATGFSVRLAYAGHNFSGPILGPDGRLYVSSPDKGMHVTSQEGRTFAHPLSGTISRCELDGSNFEVFAYGLRNVQQPAFDQFGNLFGVDNDADLKGEKERLVYITEGSDHGWRNNWQYRGNDWCPWMDEGLSIPIHSGQPAYITPPLQSYKDGPAGMVFNPGTALNSFYTDHFFMSGFPAGKLFAFKLEPAGAAFKMTGEHQVASGFLMVGMGFGPEGALYLADWSAKGYELNEKGAVWKLDDPSQAGSEYREHIGQLLAADWSKPETFDLTKHLANPDQRVRMKAQFELVRRNALDALEGAFADTTHTQLARLHALWGLGQLGRTGRALPAAPFVLALKGPDPEIQAQTAKTVSEIPDLAPAVVPVLTTLLTARHDRPRFFAAIALGRLQASSATKSLVTYLARNGTDPYHRHAGIMGLTGCATPAELSALTTHNSRPVRLAAVVALRRQGAAEIVPFLADADPLVVSEAASAIHDDTSIPGALPALASLLTSTKHSARTLRRALSAALRLRTPQQAELVANFAANSSAAMPLRLVALDLLQQWPRPAKLDSVEGHYRALPDREASDFAPTLTPILTTLLDHPDPALQMAARRAASTYGIGTDPIELLALVRKDDPTISPDALDLLASHPELYTAAASLALKSKHDLIRAAGLKALVTRKPSEFPDLARNALANGGLLESRAALSGLALIKHPGVAVVLLPALQALRSGEFPPALELDLLEALRKSKDAKIQGALANYDSKQAGNPLAPYAGTLVGGDATRGEDLFNNHLAAQCIRCHAVGSGGSTVGPNLANIGQKDPTYLLESLVDPGKVVAPGFGLLTLTLHNGESLAGTLLAESPESLTLRLADESTRTISQDQITSKSPSGSAMPPMQLLLNPPELRDVLAYLQSLQ